MEVAYDKLDLHSGDICYGIKKHDPEKNVHSTSSNSQAIKDEVFSLPKMQRVIQEVKITAPELKMDVCVCVCVCVGGW